MTFRDGPPTAEAVSNLLRRAVGRPGFKTTEDEATNALGAFDLIFPELLNYRGGWFRASRFNAVYADQWFEKFDGDVQRVESMVNHLDVFQDYPGRDGAYEIAEANALADVLTYAWPQWAMQRYGIEIVCRIYFEAEGDREPEAATLTFWSVRP